ncbi:hypothetical protein CBL_01715 [Carabus blaptoides fortunei]
MVRRFCVVFHPSSRLAAASKASPTLVRVTVAGHPQSNMVGRESKVNVAKGRGTVGSLSMCAKEKNYVCEAPYEGVCAGALVLSVFIPHLSPCITVGCYSTPLHTAPSSLHYGVPPSGVDLARHNLTDSKGVLMPNIRFAVLTPGYCQPPKSPTLIEFSS